jgi:hypothetical protein
VVRHDVQRPSGTGLILRCRLRQCQRIRLRGGREEQDVVGVDHRGIRCVAMTCPNRPAVEGRQRLTSLVHVGEAA